MFCIRDCLNKTNIESKACEINPDCTICNFSHGVGKLVDIFHDKKIPEKEARVVFGLLCDMSSDFASKKMSISDIINTRYPKQGV